MLPLMQTSSKPIAFVMLGDAMPLADEFMSEVHHSGAPVFRSMDRALRAMAYVVAPAGADGAASRESRGLPPLALPNVNGPLTEFESKQALKAAGLRCPRRIGRRSMKPRR